MAESGKKGTPDKYPMTMISPPLKVMRLRFDGPNPSAGGLQTINSARFGMTRDGGARLHQGVDLDAEIGTPIYSVADGWVSFAGESKSHYGTIIIISFRPADAWVKYLSRQNVGDEDGVFHVLYAHLDSCVAREGLVRRGQFIGTTGVSGNGDQKYPHLHFEVSHVNKFTKGIGRRIDPELLFKIQIPTDAISLAKRMQNMA